MEYILSVFSSNLESGLLRRDGAYIDQFWFCNGWPVQEERNEQRTDNATDNAKYKGK